MKRNQIQRIISIVFILFLFLVESLNASSATVLVSARVMPWVNMNVQQHQKNFTIASDDVGRSYIDIPYSVTVDIETNVSVLVLSLDSPGSEQLMASVSGENRFDTSLQLALTDNEKNSRHITRTLDFRVILDRDSQVGTHDLNAWLSIQAF